MHPSGANRPRIDPPVRLDFVAAAAPGAEDRLRPGQVLDADALDLLYAHPAPENGWVRTNFVSTLDGSAVGRDGRSGSINTASDRHVFATLRAHADVVLVGAGTVRAEGYRAIDLQPWQRALRLRLGLTPVPLLAVLSSSLDVDASVAPHREAGADAGEDAGEEGQVVIMTSAGSDPQRREQLGEAGVEVIDFDTESVSVEQAVACLVRRGCPRVLCEGGASLNRRLLAAGLVDEACLTLSARMIGGDGGRTVTGDLLDPEAEFTLAHLLHSDDGALFTRYLLRR